MKELVLVTSPVPLLSEQSTLLNLLEVNPDYLHVRKPGLDHTLVRNFVNALPKEWRKKVALHDHHELQETFHFGGLHYKSDRQAGSFNEGLRYSRSIHSIAEMDIYPDYDYLIFGPVFPSFSKEGYKPKYSLAEISEALHKRKSSNKIFAIGGIDSENTGEVLDAGFDGVAVMGTIWKKLMVDDMKEELSKVKKICEYHRKEAV